MSALKKRKVSASAPAVDVAPSRPSKSAKSAKPAKPTKPAEPSAPETSDDDDDHDEQDAAADSTPAADDVPASDTPTKTFADLGVREELCDACENLKFTHPTPIQAQAIPLALAGRDVIGLAETGSGKTAAFVLPILQALLDKPQSLFGLIMAPTRELAYQISQQVDALGSIINVKCATLVGGMDMVPQAIALSKNPHIVVATPGTLVLAHNLK